MSRSQQAAIASGRVIHSGRKAMLGSETIIRSENAKAVQREGHGHRAMRFGRTPEVATAMQIEKNAFSRAWRFDPLARNFVHLRRRNPHRGGNFVRQGAKDFAREPVIAATLEAPLDAPFGNPDRKMRLNAGHDWRRGAIRCTP